MQPIKYKNILDNIVGLLNIAHDRKLVSLTGFGFDQMSVCLSPNKASLAKAAVAVPL